MNESIKKRIHIIESAIADQVAIVLDLTAYEKGAMLIDIAELIRQRRQLLKLLVGESEIGRAA